MYHPSNDQRGGFQDRDQGVSRAGGFGPDYGADFARYADQSNPEADAKLKAQVEELLHDLFHDELTVTAKNGFVFLRGEIRDNVSRDSITGAISALPFVKQLINETKIAAEPNE